MELSKDNYFSQEANATFMSQSQFKLFEDCEAAAKAELDGEYSSFIDAFLEGNYFEAIVCGQRAQFEANHAEEIISSRGETKGQPKANYKSVISASEAFLRQPAFQSIIARCEQQLILTGEIAGFPFKCMIDFFDHATNSEWDLKCMRDFKNIFNERERHYEAWYYGRGYHYQAAITRELIRQNFGSVGDCGIVAATKEPNPDVAWIVFDNERLDLALDIVKEFTPRYARIKRGQVVPDMCGICPYCREHKILVAPELINEYE